MQHTVTIFNFSGFKPMKKYSRIFFLLISAFPLAENTAPAQTTFYDLNTIQRIEVTFTQPDWDYQMDTAKAGSEGYIMAQSVKVNGIEYDSVGVKYKGNSSYNSGYIKNPLHISLNEYKSQSYQGIKDIKLGNGYSDPSMIREVLSYTILQNYMDCPRANFAELYINGAYIGLYSNDESINKKFCSDHFYSSDNTLIKCNPVVTPGPSTKSNLKYITSDSSSYFSFYEIKSDYGWNDLVTLSDTVSNHSASVNSGIDMDRAMWMLAFNNTLINLDSYTGVFAQNYYLYKDNTGRFNPVVWDLNMSFGGFPFIGSGTTSLGSLTVANMEQLSPSVHSADSNWPLIRDMINNASYKKMYIAHMRTILNEMFVSNTYQSEAAQMQSLIDTAVAADTNKFYSYTQFQNGMTTDYPVGSYTVPGISNLMTARIAYLQSLSDFTAVPPAISAVAVSDTMPEPDSVVTVTALVTNAAAGSVYLGYRFHASDRFTKVLMYDDGLHNDGAAGDNAYGASFAMLDAQAQYYIYAENADAGIFSPQRAEHEFYTLQSSVQNPLAGEVVINEFMASNDDYMTNDYGHFEDWIELYNTASSAKSLFGLHLSDNFSDPSKFTFPANTVIPGHGYLIVWADQDSSTSAYVHANFKLSAGGEAIMLSDAAGNVLDSVSFGAQTTNISTGRCPNGTGPFAMIAPTFSASNCVTGIEENTAAAAVNIFPNPASSAFTVDVDAPGKTNTIRIISATGELVFTAVSAARQETVDVSAFAPGLYIVSVNNKIFSKLQIVR